MDLNVKNLSDQDIVSLIDRLKAEQKERDFSKMSDSELFKIAKAKNEEYSDVDALFALNLMFKREKPDLEKIATLKQMSHSEDVREACEEFLFPKD